jgi:glycosyltransferase involved in cell wall biosynthesis
MKKEKKIAIVYDWIDKWGGVERVLLTLHEMFPKAVFYTSIYDKESAGWAKGLHVKTSFMQNLPRFIKKNRVLSIPFYGPAFESLDLKSYDLVISVTSSFAKSVVTGPEALHVCYLLTPTRFLWSHQENYFKKNFINNLFLGYLRNWDKSVSQRPDRMISISNTVRDRCKKYYGIDTPVIYPPFDTKYWRTIKAESDKYKPMDQKYFLVVSRLEAYKNVDLAVRAFAGSKDRLVVVGEGTMAQKLREMAGKNVTFLSKISDQELGTLYKNAQALIMPQEEDFGYVSIEAQFFGTPVISYIKGGASETIVDGKTGIFFERLSETLLRQAIARFKRIGYNLKANVMAEGEKAVIKFDRNKFKKEFKKNL